MNGDQLAFEAEPFELEAEAGRRPPGQSRPRPPIRRPPRRRPWGRPPLLVTPRYGDCAPCPNEGRACETVLVLEGFAADQTGLAAHHGAMLQRLAAFFNRAAQRPRSIEVDARSAGGREVRRAEAAARYLRTRLRGAAVTTLSSRSRGPERVEIRFCFAEEEP